MFFDSWEGIGRLLLVGTLAYVALIVLLRVSGKRTLSKMNAFDFIVTVALGSTLASVILSKDLPLAEGVVALALLIVLQYVVAWASVRWNWVNGLVKASPALLFYKGECIASAMKSERVTEDEIHAAIRAQGLSDIEVALAVVLETDGSLTVVKGKRDGLDTDVGKSSSLKGIHNFPPDTPGK